MIHPPQILKNIPLSTGVRPAPKNVTAMILPTCNENIRMLTPICTVAMVPVAEGRYGNQLLPCNNILYTMRRPSDHSVMSIRLSPSPSEVVPICLIVRVPRRGGILPGVLAWGPQLGQAIASCGIFQIIRGSSGSVLVIATSRWPIQAS